MTIAVAVRDARAVLQVTRRQERLVRAAAARRAAAERAAAGRGKAARASWASWQRIVFGSVRLLGPAAVPFCAWAYLREGGRQWLPFAAVAVMLYVGQMFASHVLDLSATDVLRQPSKAGVVFARLWRRLPVQLAVGGCWALACALLLGARLRDDATGAVPLLLAVAIAPCGWLGGRLAARLAAGRTGGDSAVLSPLLLPALAGFLVWSRIEVGFDVASIVVLALFAPLAVAAAATLAVQWRRRPRVHAGVLAAELATLPRFAWAVVLLVPRPQLAVQWLASRPAAAFAVLLFALATLVLALRRIAREMPHAEARTVGAMEQRADAAAPRRPQSGRAAAAPPAVHRGRSPLRAAWLLHRAKFVPLRGVRSLRQFAARLPGTVATALVHLWGPILAVLAATGRSEAIHHRLLAIAAGLTAPTFVGAPIDRYRHRLGVDCVEQLRLRLFALAWFAALPTCTAAVVAALLAPPDPSRTVVLAVLGATFALRAGWRGLLRTGETGAPSRARQLVLLGLGGALALPLPILSSMPAGGLLVPAVVGALGLLGLVHRVRRGTERRLVAELVANAERRTRPVRVSADTAAMVDTAEPAS